MVGKLTAAFVKTAKVPGKYHDGDGLGLLLRVDPNGARFWIQRIVIRGKRREIGLGSPPTVGLAEARENAIENKRAVRSGRDPIAEKRKSNAVLNFEQATRLAHIELSPTWRNPKDRAAFLSTMERYIFPRFGHVSLTDLRSADVRKAILAARTKAPTVARKLTYRVSAVFKWGIAEGLCDINPATPDALALPRVAHKVQHRKALPYRDVAGCITSVMASKAGEVTKLALEFVILTATRSGETRNALWREIKFHDDGTAVWEIPAERIKMKRPHRVPLSGRAVEILIKAGELGDRSDLVFPGTKRGKPLSDMTLSKLIKELGFDADVHGFRTSFRTWAQEQTNFPREVAEMALAHIIGDASEQAYARSDMFDKRALMMAAWGDYLNGHSEGAAIQGRVIPLRGV